MVVQLAVGFKQSVLFVSRFHHHVGDEKGKKSLDY